MAASIQQMFGEEVLVFFEGLEPGTPIRLTSLRGDHHRLGTFVWYFPTTGVAVIKLKSAHKHYKPDVLRLAESYRFDVVS